MDCGLHPSHYLTGPFGEQLEGVVRKGCHGWLLTRDPDCPRCPKIEPLLPLLHSLLPVTWEPGTDKPLLSLMSWGTRAVSLGQWWSQIHGAGRMPSKHFHPQAHTQYMQQQGSKPSQI